MDISLVSETEDSLILLHRPNSREDWNEYDHYTKNVLGDASNATGYVELSKVLPGEYVLANVDQSVLSAPVTSDIENARVFPNPSNGKITVINNVGDVLGIKVFSMDGKIADEKAIKKGSDQVEISVESSGIYLYELLDTNKKVVEKGKIIIQK